MLVIIIMVNGQVYCTVYTSNTASSSTVLVRILARKYNDIIIICINTYLFIARVCLCIYIIIYIRRITRTYIYYVYAYSS